MINNELTLTVNDNKIIACRRAGYVFSGNCGGLGRCQRCLVDVKGAGTVKSCTYTITDNIQITIGEDNMSVLASYKGADESNNVYNGDGRGIGIAIDLGTTTIAIEQIDMSDGSVTDRCGFMNPRCHIKDPNRLHRRWTDKAQKLSSHKDFLRVGRNGGCPCRYIKDNYFRKHHHECNTGAAASGQSRACTI